MHATQHTVFSSLPPPWVVVLPLLSAVVPSPFLPVHSQNSNNKIHENGCTISSNLQKQITVQYAINATSPAHFSYKRQIYDHGSLTWSRRSLSCSSSIFCCSIIFFISANSLSISFTRSLCILSKSFCPSFVACCAHQVREFIISQQSKRFFTRVSILKTFNFSM